MKKESLSYAMFQAVGAWRSVSGISQAQAIARHAVAHGVSAGGLRRALLAAELIQKKAEKAAIP
jgi:hypothetical protein